eukprot:Skav207873  [mRNA]  locus=scaffold664:12608:17290:+ [translate_table: standard]
MSDELHLETNWGNHHGCADCLADVVIYDPKQQKHLIRSSLARKFLTLQGKLDPSAVACTILNGKVLEGCHGLHVCVPSDTDESFLLSHKLPTTDCLTNAIELCSGIGALGSGLEHNGYQVKVRNELRESFVKLLAHQGYHTSVTGDVGSPQVIAQIHALCPESALHAAGFPCQPWSLLGDRNRTHDLRGKTLHAILRTAFLLRAHTIVLECVVPASEDVEVTRLICKWCRITGFNARECKLDLHCLWPSKRSRWWVLLSFPGSNPVELMPLPSMHPLPCVADVIPMFPSWPVDQTKQLALDAYETRMYNDYGDMSACVVNMNQPLATALHSLGNHFTGCPCGCRDWPLRLERLAKQGIHGILVPLPDEAGTKLEPRFRLIHPWELSLLLGLNPNTEWLPNLKLSLCGLGQIASPIQSGWIVSQHLWGNHDHDLNPMHTPEHQLWLQLDQLFAARNQVFPVQQYGAKTQDFSNLLRNQLALASQSRLVSRGLPATEDIAQCITATALLPLEATPKRLTRSECEMLEHEEQSPCSASVTSHEQLATEDPYEELADATEEDWETFQRVSPDTGGSITEVLPTQSEAKLLWEQRGAIPAFQLAPKTEASEPVDVTFTATWKDSEEHMVDSTHDVEVANDATEHVLPAAETPREDIASEINQEPTHATDHHDTQMLRIRIVTAHSPAFVETSVAQGTTIQDVIDAETALQKETIVGATNLLGQQFEVTQVVQDNMWIRLVFSRTVPVENDSTRLQQLYQQGSWVATDEMAYYLDDHPFGDRLVTHGVLGFAPDTHTTVIHEQLSQHLGPILDGLNEQCVHAFAMVSSNHWIPFVIHLCREHSTQFGYVDKPCIVTSVEGFYFLNEMNKKEYGLVQTVNVKACEIPQVFRGDCGFQIKVWMLNTIGGIIDPEWISHAKVQPFQAEQWRTQFHSHLLATGEAFDSISQLITGGMGGTDASNAQLEELLLSHGVPNGEVGQRAADVITQLGRHAINVCLRSAHPWRDLKAKANAHTPRLQLIMPGELAARVQQRALSDQPIKSKKKQAKPQSKPQGVRIAPSDIAIPDGIFQTFDGAAVGQLTTMQIGPEAQGIVVLQWHEENKLGTVTRFPARSTSTQEPMLVSAKMVQVGGAAISRSQPKQTLAMEESETFVVRVTAFKDELSTPWDSFAMKPVKFILQELGLITNAKDQDTPVVDVWDRQWLNMKMVRSDPGAVSMFLVNLRLTGVSLQQLLGKSGHSGLYTEPRDETGRQPNEAFRVVWLPNTDKHTALAAIQTSPHWASLVRYGHRMGLRTNSQHAEQMHSLHKPQTPFLPTAQVRQFTVGPMPFHCTKNAMAKAFTQWGWKARAIQPKGRASDGSGVLWSVQSSESPPAEVYQMSHGDIIVTEDASKKSPPEKPATEILASAKTVAAIRNRGATFSSASTGSGDPWEHFDPWQSTTNKQPRLSPPELSPQQFRALEESLRDKMAPASTDPPDVDMQDHTRINALEARMQVMETSLQQQAQTQQQQHAEVTNSIAQVQKNLDQQSTAYETLLDARFSEQLQHMERLIGKRFKAGPEASSNGFE